MRGAPVRSASRVSSAGADVDQSFDTEPRGPEADTWAGTEITPGSGKFLSAARDNSIDRAASKAGAMTGADRATREDAFNRQFGVAELGQRFSDSSLRAQTALDQLDAAREEASLDRTFRAGESAAERAARESQFGREIATSGAARALRSAQRVRHLQHGEFGFRGSESAADRTFRGAESELQRLFHSGESAAERDQRESQFARDLDYRGTESAADRESSRLADRKRD